MNNLFLNSSTVLRNRFEAILGFLHFADNASLLEGHKMAKVRPLYTMLNLNERFLRFNPKQQILSVEEIMILYYSPHCCKQFIHEKPIRFGYKMWCLNTTLGYLIQCEPHQGAGTVSTNKSLGMGGSVVMDLISELPADKPYLIHSISCFILINLSEIDRCSYRKRLLSNQHNPDQLCRTMPSIGS